LLVFLLAAGSIIEGYKMTGFSASMPAGKSLHPFLTGIFLSATNSLHIPSWLGWGTVLHNKKIMLPYSNHYNWYIAGITVVPFWFLWFLFVVVIIWQRILLSARMY
jgi:hypothetical protein